MDGNYKGMTLYGHLKLGILYNKHIQTKKYKKSNMTRLNK
jgi:hypothetical protein